METKSQTGRKYLITKKEMMNTLTFFRYGILLLAFGALPGWSVSQVYVDLLVGAHPQFLNDGGASVHINGAIGYQGSTNVGYGVCFGGMSVLSVSTTRSFSTFGVQYRWLGNQRHKYFAKAEFGTLLNASYTTDGPYLYEYESGFNPYFRIYTGYRLGRFTVALNYTRITPFSESILAYDENTGDFLPTNDIRHRDQHDLQLSIGFMLDNFRPIKKIR
jgi:hypothetical protein